MNRRLLAYKRWNSAKQGKEQKVSIFKAHLEELETHLEPLPQVFRASMLSKFCGMVSSKVVLGGIQAIGLNAMPHRLIYRAC